MGADGQHKERRVLTHEDGEGLTSDSDMSYTSTVHVRARLLDASFLSPCVGLPLRSVPTCARTGRAPICKLQAELFYLSFTIRNTRFPPPCPRVCGDTNVIPSSGRASPWSSAFCRAVALAC